MCHTALRGMSLTCYSSGTVWSLSSAPVIIIIIIISIIIYMLLLLKIHTAIDDMEGSSFIACRQQQIVVYFCWPQQCISGSVQQACPVLNGSQVVFQSQWYRSQCCHYHWNNLRPHLPHFSHFSCKILVLFLVFIFSLTLISSGVAAPIICWWWWQWFNVTAATLFLFF